VHLKTLQHCARRTPARWAAWGRQPMVEEKCACAVESGHTYIDSAVLCAADPRALGSLEPTSPRSVEACLRLGIEPASLQFRPLETFQLSREAGDLAQLAFNFNEAVRQARLSTISRLHLSGRTSCCSTTSFA
jgi:hypothetical protein